MQIRPPIRAERTYTQRLVAAPANVFPLLCPVREVDWIEGWRPLAVISESGVAERDCVFVTASAPDEAIWVITRHEPQSHFVEMLKITPQVTVCRLGIQLRPADGGCEAIVTYLHISLGPRGDAFVESFTDAFYGQFMRDWEARLNHYLQHGDALRAADATP